MIMYFTLGRPPCLGVETMVFFNWTDYCREQIVVVSNLLMLTHYQDHMVINRPRYEVCPQYHAISSTISHPLISPTGTRFISGGINHLGHSHINQDLFNPKFDITDIVLDLGLTHGTPSNFQIINSCKYSSVPCCFIRTGKSIDEHACW